MALALNTGGPEFEPRSHTKDLGEFKIPDRPWANPAVKGKRLPEHTADRPISLVCPKIVSEIPLSYSLDHSWLVKETDLTNFIKNLINETSNEYDMYLFMFYRNLLTS